jgi:hypothetical protein
MQDRSSFTISEFCARNGFSRGFYYKMKRAGIGPREMIINDLIRIPVEAEADWKRERQAASGKQPAAENAAA